MDNSDSAEDEEEVHMKLRISVLSELECVDLCNRQNFSA